MPPPPSHPPSATFLQQYQQQQQQLNQFNASFYQQSLRATDPAIFAQTASQFATNPSTSPLVDNPNLIDCILLDHAHAMALFSHFFQSASLDQRHTLAMITGALALELRLHSHAELQFVYPIFTERLPMPEGRALIQRALAEHLMMEESLKEMLLLRANSEMDALILCVKKLQTETMTHTAEEEARVLPLLSTLCTPEELVVKGFQFRAAKCNAPLMPQGDLFRSALSCLSAMGGPAGFTGGGGGGSVPAPATHHPTTMTTTVLMDKDKKNDGGDGGRAEV